MCLNISFAGNMLSFSKDVVKHGHKNNRDTADQCCVDDTNSICLGQQSNLSLIRNVFKSISCSGCSSRAKINAKQMHILPL